MMKSENYQRNSVLFASTLAFLICFMTWMTMGVIGIPLRNELQLSATEFGILTATPVLSGSLIRLPLGMWTDRFGGRAVMSILLIICIPAIYCISLATEYWQFLVIGLVMGLAGGSFSVGVPYVTRWFPKTMQGFSTGVFGIGTAGTALNNFIAPQILKYSDGNWRIVPEIYAAILLATLIIFWLTSYSKSEHVAKTERSVKRQLLLLKDVRVLRYSQFYTVVFGGYVGLTLWLNNYYVNQYGLSLTNATLLALLFLVPGSVARALGGYLSDKVGANRVSWTVMRVLWIVFLILSIPHMNMSWGGEEHQLGLSLEVFAALSVVVGGAMSIGSGSVFKSIANDYPTDIGTVSGIVGLAGGIFGFILPIAFGMLYDWTGIRETALFLVFIGVSVTLLWMRHEAKCGNL